MINEHILPGPPPLNVALRRSARAKRYSLRVSKLDGRVTLTLPSTASLKAGLAFVAEREEWLRHHLATRTAPLVPQIGGTFLYKGADVPIVAGPVRRPVLRDGQLLVPQDPTRLLPRLSAFLKTEARTALVAASDSYAAKLGHAYGRITLRDTRSRWGSCTSKGDLMYSWRLIMAPPAVLDYVAAHEVAHLAQMNHSPAFWAEVERICPGHTPYRRWLKKHGESLHAVQLQG